MSFVTRCPACSTQFRVVADQLKISEGWVRCGHCAEVFDATADLTAWPPGPTAPVVPAPDPAVEPPSDEAPMDWPDAVHALAEQAYGSPEETDAPEAWTEAAEQRFEADADPAPSTEDAPEDETASGDAQAVVDVDEPLEDAQAEEVPPEAAPLMDSDESLDTGEAVGDAGLEPDAPLLDDLPPAAQDLHFIRQAHRRAFWKRPAVRAGLGGLSLLLVLGLVLQWMVHERDRIAAIRPDFKPYLQALCRPLGCEVKPLRWLDAVGIDSSTLTRRAGNRFDLEVVLRNSSLFAVAVPALELSLTDVRDQLVLRRVVLPTEWAPPDAVLPAGGDLVVKLDLLVDNTVGAAMSGYRTLAFYP